MDKIESLIEISKKYIKFKKVENKLILIPI